MNGDSVDLSGADAARFAFEGRAPFSLELWVHPDTIDGVFRTHLHKGSWPGPRWTLDLSSDYGFGCLRTVDGVNQGPTQSTDFRPLVGRYLHLVCTYDGTWIELYVNGLSMGKVRDERSLPPISGRAEVGPNALSVIDEVAIYPAALPPARVLAHYEAGAGVLGERKFTSSVGFALTDRSELGVNVCTGNLLVHALDVRVESLGIDAVVDRWYNSLPSDGGELGQGWYLGTATDVRLQETAGGSMIFLGPSGYRAVFVRQADGSYATPAGLDARLARSAEGWFTLSWNGSPVRYTFDAGLDLVDVRDRHGNKVWFGFSGGNANEIWDQRNRKLSLSYNPAGFLTLITDAANRTWQYGYGASSQLTTYTDPELGITTYEYDPSGRMTKITTPGGRETRVGYDAKGRVASLVRVTDKLAGTGPTTRFAYSGQTTVVTDARDYSTTYTCEDPGRVTSVKDALNRTVSTSFDGNSNALSFTNALGKLTSFGYDTGGNLTSQQSPTGARRSWTYDLSGPNPTSRAGGRIRRGT